MAAECEFASHHVGPSSKLPLPEGVAQHYTLYAASTVIVCGRDQTADDRLYLKNMKEISTHQQSICIVGLSTLPNVETIRSPCCYRGESLLLIIYAFPQTARQV